MRRLNALAWFYALVISIVMDYVAAGIIWEKGFDWGSGLFAAFSTIATLIFYKFYKEESK